MKLLTLVKCQRHVLICNEWDINWADSFPSKDRKRWKWFTAISSLIKMVSDLLCIDKTLISGIIVTFFTQDFKRLSVTLMWNQLLFISTSKRMCITQLSTPLYRSRWPELTWEMPWILRQEFSQLQNRENIFSLTPEFLVLLIVTLSFT